MWRPLIGSLRHVDGVFFEDCHGCTWEYDARFGFVRLLPRSPRAATARIMRALPRLHRLDPPKAERIARRLGAWAVVTLFFKIDNQDS